MKKASIYTLLSLISLTIATALISNVHYLKIVTLLILGLSGVKFLLVAFNFMELKKAHIFWKISLVSFLVFFILIIKILTY